MAPPMQPRKAIRRTYPTFTYSWAIGVDAKRAAKTTTTRTQQKRQRVVRNATRCSSPVADGWSIASPRRNRRPRAKRYALDNSSSSKSKKRKNKRLSGRWPKKGKTCCSRRHRPPPLPRSTPPRRRLAHRLTQISSNTKRNNSVTPPLRQRRPLIKAIAPRLCPTHPTRSSLSHATKTKTVYAKNEHLFVSMRQALQ